MNDEQTEKIIRLLEEIRDGQHRQLEYQAEALANQKEVLAQQRERLAGLSKRSDRVDDLLGKSAKVVASARIAAFVLVPVAVILLVFLVWILFGRGAV